MNNKLFCVTIFYLVFVFFLSLNFAQSLSRGEFQNQIQKSIISEDIDQVKQLIKQNRLEAIGFIEALLDSAVIKKAAGRLTGSQKDCRNAEIMANYYSELFKDPYYVNRSRRYKDMPSDHTQKKAEIINLKQQSRELFYQGNFKESLKKCEQALQFAETVDDIDEKANILGIMGAANFYLGEFVTALSYYQKSLHILEEIGDIRRIGNTYGNIGNVYSDQSNYPQALAYFDKAMSIRKGLDDKRGLAADFNNVGLINDEMGEYDKALEHYQMALEINRSIGNKRSIGKNLANIGNIHLNLGDYPDAIETYTISLEIRKELGDRKGEGNDYGNLGIVYQYLGDYPKARYYYQQALKIHQELGFREGEAYQLGRMANLNIQEGEYAKAIQLYQKALAIHDEIGHIRGKASWMENLSRVYTAVGDHKRALSNFESALALHKNIGNQSGESATLFEMGTTYLHLDDFKKAKDCFKNAIQIHRKLGEKWGECVALGNIAYVLSLEEDPQDAITTWREAESLAQKLDDKYLQAWLQKLLGDFYSKQGESIKAAKAYEMGLAIIEKMNVPDLRWQLYYGRGRLWENQGEIKQAYYSYRAAINVIEEIRGNALAEALKAGVLHDRFESYERIIMLLLQMDLTEEAFQYVERARARNLLDLLGNSKIKNHVTQTQVQTEREQALRAKLTRLNDQVSFNSQSGPLRGADDELYHGSLQNTQREYQQLLMDLKINNPEYASMVNVDPYSSSQIQRSLDENMVLLEYFICDENILIFVLSYNSLQAISVPQGRKNLRGNISLFRGTAVRNIDEHKLADTYWIKPLQNLYELLVLPVEKAGYLTNKDHLIIVPHDILNYLPFQALITQQNYEDSKIERPHFLVEDYAVSYVPSASVLKFCKDMNTREKKNLMLLAPMVNVLPMSEGEVLKVAENFGTEAKYYLQEDASESLVKEQGHRYDLLHFATTAHFNKTNPIFSRLDLAKSETDDGQLAVYEIYNLEFQANLVILSACKTALGSGYLKALPQGDDLVCLAHAFLYAGTSSVIASLWEIADPSTALFMQNFYENLKQMDKVQALTKTQRNMLTGNISSERKEKKRVYFHPYYWAPFVLVGDWE